MLEWCNFNRLVALRHPVSDRLQKQGNKLRERALWRALVRYAVSVVCQQQVAQGRFRQRLAEIQTLHLIATVCF